MSKDIEKNGQRLLAFFRLRITKFQRSIGEHLGISRQIIQRDISCANQSEVFQAGIGETPAPPLVCPSTMCEHSREGTLRIKLPYTLCFRIKHPFLPSALICCCE